MREILISQECITFINSQDKRVITKFYQLIEIIKEHKVIHSRVIKKIKNTELYELRIRTDNEIRVLIFAINSRSFIECKKCICLIGFKKKSSKDYKPAVLQAIKILTDYNNKYHD